MFTLLKNRQEQIQRLMDDYKDNITFERFRLVLDKAGARDLSEFECRTVYEEFAQRERFLHAETFLKELHNFELQISHFDEEQPKVLDSKTKNLLKYKHLNFSKEYLCELNQSNIRSMPAPQL